MKNKANYLIYILILMVSIPFNNAIAEETQSTLLPIYKTTTQTLSIPKLGVPSGNAGYAYQVEMKLYSNEPLGFVLTTMSDPTPITADEAISAIYQAETNSIFFPQAYIIDENEQITKITEVKLSISGDPFVWFYSAQ